MSTARGVVEQGLELFQKGDIDHLVSLHAEDAVYHGPAGPIEGHQALTDRLRQDREGFPDGQLQVDRWFQEGDDVAIEYTWTGTHTGQLTLPDGTVVPPTGRRVESRGMMVFDVREGKVASVRQHFDLMGFMTQLGSTVTPPSG